MKVLFLKLEMFRSPKLRNVKYTVSWLSTTNIFNFFLKVSCKAENFLAEKNYNYDQMLF